MKEQIIQLEPHDAFYSVRDKLGWVRAPRVLLVFPDDPACHILRKRLDLVLLQREATRRRAQLALITRDPVVIDHAGELGIACFKSVDASHRRFWRTARARLSVPRSERPTPLDPDLVEGATRLQAPARPSLPARVRRVLTVVLFGMTIATLLTGAFVILPGATVHLVPAANQVTVTTTITADPQAEPGLVDTAAALIAARMVGVEVEGSASVETTGTSLQPTDKARGIILFTNLIPNQVTIPAGTIVRTSAAQPVRYITLADATLPGQVGETVEVPVEAIQPGFEGNVPTARINQVEGPLGGHVAVTNPQPLRGGDAVERRSISEDDMSRVRALLLQQLQQRAYAELQTGLLDAMEFLPPESLEIVLVHSEVYSGYAGQVQDRISLAMRVTIQGVAIDERLARQVVYAELANKVGAGYQIGSGSLVFRPGEVVQVDDQRRVTFIMQGAGDVSAAIDTAAVVELVRGVGLREAIRRLDRGFPLAAPPQIETWPRFWPLMPLLPLRIGVEVEGQP